MDSTEPHPTVDLPSIAIGTASWTDKTLLASGRFYPGHARDARTRLQYYASRFPIAEVDSSFYALPDPATAHAWVERTPPAFTFNIKAFRLFTGHQTPIAAFDPDIRAELDPARDIVFHDQVPAELRDELWRRFLLALDPLRMADKLGLVHFQFAPWVHPDRRGLALLTDAVRRLESFVPSAEFRHTSWFTGAQLASTLALQRELGVVHTVVDAPQGMANTAPAIWETTHADYALLRLHGRNGAAWNQTGASSTSRFMYEYSPAELAELAARIAKIARQVARTHVIFNTNHEDQGMRNAQALTHALNLETLP
jgi:uncharacterized protein YecE (DUF72 family)